MASISLPAAVAIGAGVSGVGSIASGLIGSSAAQSAANTQAAAANNATQAALQQQAITRGDLAPFRQAGTDALASLRVALGLSPAGGQPTTTTTTTPAVPASAGGLPGGFSVVPTVQPSTGTGGEGTVSGGPAIVNQLIGPDGNVVGTFPLGTDLSQMLALSGITPASSAGSPATTTTTQGVSTGPANPLTANGLSGLTFNPTQATLEATPGYQFNLTQGLRGVENSASAQGRGLSGAALKGAAGYATGLASNTLGQQQQIFQQNLGNVLNPLTNLVNLGQNAAATTGQLGQQAVQSANNFAVGGANALAAGQVGSAGAIGGALGGLGNSASNFLLFNALNNSGAPTGGTADQVLAGLRADPANAGIVALGNPAA